MLTGVGKSVLCGLSVLGFKNKKTITTPRGVNVGKSKVASVVGCPKLGGGVCTCKSKARVSLILL